MNNTLESLANKAKDTICSKNPFPELDLSHGIYGCKWGLTDLYPESEKALRKAIENRETFDTGWVDCQKEIRSFRIISDVKIMTIQAFAEMDEFHELVYDAMETEVELTEEQMNELWEYYYESEIGTETQREMTIPVSTYEAAMEIIAQLEQYNDDELNGWFEIVKSWVSEVINRKESEE